MLLCTAVRAATVNESYMHTELQMSAEVVYSLPSSAVQCNPDSVLLSSVAAIYHPTHKPSGYSTTLHKKLLHAEQYICYSMGRSITAVVASYIHSAHCCSSSSSSRSSC
jgi:hypothetical protein